MERPIQTYRGRGQLIFDTDEAIPVNYVIEDYQNVTSDGLGGQLPTTKDRRGRVSHVDGHPDWHPVTPLHLGSATLVLNDERKLKVAVRDTKGSLQGSGEFY